MDGVSQNRHNRHGGAPIHRRVTHVASVVLAAVIAPPAVAAEVVKGPYLLYPDDPACMTVLLQTDEDAGEVWLRWGPTPDVDAGEAAVHVSGDHQYIDELCGLTPGQRTYYEVEVDGEVHPGSLLAAPPATQQDVVIYAYGDTRSNPDVHDAVCARLLLDVDDDPDARQTVVLHSGDWVSGGDSEVGWETQFFDRSRPDALEMMSRLAVMGARGNHEGGASMLRKYWPYAGLDPLAFAHSFDYGPLHVTVVDQYEDFAEGSEQYAWIDADLAATDRTWKIVVFHEPAWSAGAHGNDLPTQTELLPLLVEHDVAVAIGGHNHYYARAVVDGVQHVSCGGGGAPLYTPDPDEPYVVAAAEQHHFVRLAVDFAFPDATMTLTAIDVDGVVLDEVAVTRNVCGEEVCDGSDNDCDGRIDEHDAVDCTLYHVDADGDGYGPDSGAICACAPEPPHEVTAGGDCDDGDPALQPEDHDGDGYSTCEGDCADLVPAVHPGADEDCRDGLDNDCDGGVDLDDQDCAGYTEHYLPDDEAGGCACAASGGRAGVGWGLLIAVALLRRVRP